MNNIFCIAILTSFGVTFRWISPPDAANDPLKRKITRVYRDDARMYGRRCDELPVRMKSEAIK